MCTKLLKNQDIFIVVHTTNIRDERRGITSINQCAKVASGIISRKTKLR